MTHRIAIYASAGDLRAAVDEARPTGATKAEGLRYSYRHVSKRVRPYRRGQLLRNN